MNLKSETRFVWKISLVAAMGGLLFGYDWVVIGGAKPFYEAFFDIAGDSNAWLSSWAMSSALLGCLVGAILSGLMTDRLGRKKILLLAAALFTASAVWTAATSSFNWFIVARILGGLGIGLASNVSPMYIAEVAPSEKRGKLVAVNQLAIVIGVLAAQIVNLLIYNIAPVAPDALVDEMAASWNGQTGWRIMFLAEAVPSLAFLILSSIIPESPRWLASKSRHDEALDVLTKVGGTDYANNELAQIKASIQQDAQRESKASFRQPAMRKILFLGLFLAVFQQWCGINVIFNYAEEIFVAAGYNVSGMMFNIVITGIVNLIFTLLAIRVVDKWGRRPLMIMGAGGLAVCYAALGASYFYQLQGVFVLAIVLVSIAVYAMTLAPITWVLLSEIFPNQIRGASMSMCVSALWIACFLLTITFKPINAAFGPAGTFWLYGVICLVGFSVMMFVVPETKGRSLESIQEEMLNND
jgi:SP family sugar porter-like MFS transporter